MQAQWQEYVAWYSVLASVVARACKHGIWILDVSLVLLLKQTSQSLSEQLSVRPGFSAGAEYQISRRGQALNLVNSVLSGLLSGAVLNRLVLNRLGISEISVKKSFESKSRKLLFAGEK